MDFAVREGRLLADGEPFTALGVNYHPSAAGCRIWSDWDPGALRRDMGDIAAAGLNTVRLFVFWRDFEPTEGHVDADVLDRLSGAVAAARDHGLCCVLSLFTLFMNGRLLDLGWRAGRSLWRDAALLEREEDFARQVARAVRGHGNVLAFDLGDEITAVDPGDADGLTPADVTRWYARMAGALHKEAPGTLVLQANNASSVFGHSPFGPETAGRALDLTGIHGFPYWSPGAIESTSSYKATSLNAFLVRYAAAHGTPLVDELGSYGTDEATAAGYLRASAASALANGARGVLAWCWQDIASTEEPYRSRPAERSAGLRRLDGSAKPALGELTRLAGAAHTLAPRRPAARTALYLGEEVRSAPGSYLDHGAGTLVAFFSHLLLTRAHLDFDVVAGDVDGHGLVICPCLPQLTLRDLERVEAAAAAGATVYLSLGDHLHGFPGEHLAGVRLVDYSLDTAGRTSLRWRGHEWPVGWGAATGRPAIVRATTARVLASFADGTPALTENRVGAGRVVFTPVPVEQLPAAPGALEREPWHLFYREVAAIAGVAPVAEDAHPDVEIVTGDGTAVLINHGTVPRSALGVTVDAKDWSVVDLGGDEG
ncbi:hypothetical protein AB0F13_10640 [Streptomyces sp. NPDC026206]|uniref:beta-galactosidase trimerization domain-containing protein n=1 Tax=Streptomyces sp. NPDC026206 TaxID=3157089 RepID=UPI0033FBF1EC